MKILLDEDTPIQLLDVLAHLLPDHVVHHVGDVRWQAKKDVPLIRDAARRGYLVLVTVDSNQFDDPDEVDAIRKSGMHHVRFAQRHQGLRGLGVALGSVFASMPAAIAELERADGQRLVKIVGVDPTPAHRFELIDPQANPPKYWPR